MGETSKRRRQKKGQDKLAAIKAERGIKSPQGGRGGGGRSWEDKLKEEEQREKDRVEALKRERGVVGGSEKTGSEFERKLREEQEAKEKEKLDKIRAERGEVKGSVTKGTFEKKLEEQKERDKNRVIALRAERGELFDNKRGVKKSWEKLGREIVG